MDMPNVRAKKVLLSNNKGKMVHRYTPFKAFKIKEMLTFRHRYTVEKASYYSSI